VRGYACVSEPGRDMRIPTRVLRDAVDEKQVRSFGANRGPPIRAEVESVSRASASRGVAQSSGRTTRPAGTFG
jgi:hypothetical protein